MSYRTSVNLNRLKYDESVINNPVKIVKVLQHEKLINYLYVSNIAAFSIDNNNEFLYPDGDFTFELGRSITPKFFKLEYIALPNTFYEQSNNRKLDTRPQVNPLIKQNAPLKMVWREQNGGPVQTFIKDLEPGNYSLDELIVEIELLMNQSPNNQYKLTFDEITFRLHIDRISGVYEFALWFPTFQENEDYYIKDVEQFVSEFLGYSVIPLVDDFETSKVSPLVCDVSNDSILLMELVGTPAILNQTALNSAVQATFNSTFIINYNGNKGDFSTFTINKDFVNQVTIANKLTFSNVRIVLRNFQTGQIIHFNGSTPYMIFSYEEYGLHENFNN